MERRFTGSSMKLKSGKVIVLLSALFCGSTDDIWALDKLEIKSAAPQPLLIANVVPSKSPQTEIDPRLRLSLSAQEVAKDLGIFTGAEELLDAKRKAGADSLDVIRVRQRLLETILIASFEIRSAISRIDDEISRANELRNVMEDRREKKVQRNDVLNFVNSGTTGILSSALTDFPKGAGINSGGLLHAGGAVGVIGGALEIGISTISLKLNKGEHRSALAHPNMLAPLFGYVGSDAKLPDGVFEYLTDTVPGATNKLDTRQNRLLQAWLHLGRLYSPSTKTGQHQIGLVAGLIPQTNEVTIDLLEDRALMLSDLRAAVSQMDIEMLEIIRWVRTL